MSNIDVLHSSIRSLEVSKPSCYTRTPDRAMRHLDGVYTQRYNQEMHRDGPIFRGRYKSILVEADTYLLRLSRYIHLNPVASKLVRKAEAYL